MKIIDILDLLAFEKSITILTPNYIESKLLRDRIKLHATNFQLIDNNTLKINDSKIILVTPETFCLDPASKLIVEFPNSLPYSVLNKLWVSDIIYCSEIV